MILHVCQFSLEIGFEIYWFKSLELPVGVNTFDTNFAIFIKKNIKETKNTQISCDVYNPSLDIVSITIRLYKSANLQ